MQVWEVNLSIGINVFPGFYHHGTCGFDKTDGRVVGIRVKKPQADGNVVHISYRRGTYSIGKGVQHKNLIHLLELDEEWTNFFESSVSIPR